MLAKLLHGLWMAVIVNVRMPLELMIVLFGGKWTLGQRMSSWLPMSQHGVAGDVPVSFHAHMDKNTHCTRSNNIKGPLINME